MCTGNQSTMFENFIQFTLETSPYNDGQSDGVHVPTMKPKVLSLFPLTPSFKPLRKESSISRRPSARHGPRPKSSPFRGVTHYKRTKRWEAHIWNKGRQVYLGASSTSEKAARAYDRAAIHFRKMNAELNFSFEDYTGELRRLVEISDSELEKMLRKQSAGDGTLYPEYPPDIQLQLSTPMIFGVPIYFTATN